MCRWNFMQLVRHPRIQALHYYCRLDTHSFVRSPLGRDVFDFMAARRLKYGFVVAEEEPAHVIAGAVLPASSHYIFIHIHSTLIKALKQGLYFNFFGLAQQCWAKKFV